MNDEPPRAALNEDGTFGPYARLRCVCCGAPSITVPEWIDPRGDDPTWPQVCVLCEWENAGPDAPPEHAGSDDGVSLAEARANFDRYRWMYDPTRPRPWMREVASRAELRARAALRDVYRAIDREPEGPRFYALWEVAREAEDTVAELTRTREQVVESSPEEVSEDEVVD